MIEVATANDGDRNRATQSSENDSLRTMRRRILVAEDDADVRAMLLATLVADGYDVLEASHGLEALDRIAAQLLHQEAPNIDLLITDVRMPGITGLSLVRGLRQADWNVPIVVVTAYGNDALRHEVHDLGALLLEKPLDFDDLRTVLWNAVPSTKGTLPYVRRAVDRWRWRWH